MVVVIMGVSGSGKSTVGARLAGALGWRFVDADALHPAENVTKMRSGEPLDDVDRGPWVDALATAVAAWLRRGEDVVLAWSGLRSDQRARLAVDPARMRWVWLDGSKERVAARLGDRIGHFMPVMLLGSQLEALQPPEDALRLDVDAPPDELVHTIRTALKLG